MKFYEIRIIVGMGQAPHLRNRGSDESQMEKYGSDGEGGIRLHIACILLVGIQPPCSRPYKNGGTSNPNTGNSSNDRL